MRVRHLCDLNPDAGPNETGELLATPFGKAIGTTFPANWITIESCC